MRRGPAAPLPHDGAAPVLSTRDLELRFGRRAVLRHCTLQIEAGSMTALLGRNGAGKSTLLRCLSGVLAPHKGMVLLEGRPLGGLRRREIAQMMAVVPQDVTMPFSFSVREMVGLGRTPHLRSLAGLGPADAEVVERTLARLDLLELADRRFETLSAGERQRAILAMAMAQQPRLALLDEPVAHLDVAHQLEVLTLLRGLHGQGLTVLATMHDLNLAALAFDRLLLLHDGSIIAAGTPAEVLNAETVHIVYGARVLIAPHPTRGVPQVTLLP